MKRLQLKTHSINLLIENYKPYVVSITGGFLIKDTYKPIFNGERGEYHLIIEYCNDAPNDSLFDVAIQMNKIASLINKCFKYVTCLTIGEQGLNFDSYTKTVLYPGDPPKGWETNYYEVSSSNTGISFSIIGDHYSTHEESPLLDLRTAISNYNKLEQAMKDLVDLHLSFDFANDTVRYLIFGKAIEIIDTKFPIINSNRNRDNRIEYYWPHLSEVFKDKTIKDYLRKLSNTRKETRHYINQADKSSSHPPMSTEERKLFYELTDTLIFTIIREKLGLSPIMIERE